MAVERLKSIASHLVGKPVSPAHPFDPLSTVEIDLAVSVIRQAKGDAYFFNCVTLAEPDKGHMVTWLEDIDANGLEKASTSRPTRFADIVAIGKGSKVFDALVDLDNKILTKWEQVEGVQPLITMEDLQLVETLVRKDRKVIEQCGILGILPNQMDKVYCDPWTIGYDHRFGSSVRLQQALMYYRPHIDDCQYTYPLDFCPIFNADTHEIIHIDVPDVRRPLNTAKPTNYHADAIRKEAGGFRTDLKPINITQPQGVSFTMSGPNGREISWANWKLNIGFNYREGLVLHDIRFKDRDQGNRYRPVFWRLSLAEMVVPYGNPEHPHQRKHAFDLGEYGGGYMTNSLALGCDCKGAIHYLDFPYVTKTGEAKTIKNAVCIHEEDTGILFKHTDFRDDSCTVTRGRKLVMSHVFTAANYEYAVYWNLHLDGTVQLEIKLTGILNTYAMNPDESTNGYGTQVYPGVNAHNHQHLFCLRIDPSIDSRTSGNTVFQSDAVADEAPVGSADNPYGNAFRCKKVKYQTVSEALADYDGSTSRTWDIVNENVVNRYSKAPVGYKLVSREVPKLLPKEGSLVWKRAGFARQAVAVTRYSPTQSNPAGRHVPQTSGDSISHPTNSDLPAWISAKPTAKIDNEDIVLWHTFGLTHFPSPEDYPVMPAEPMQVLLRPRHFFERNPCLDVPPSFSRAPSQIISGKEGWKDVDRGSRGV